MCAHAYLYMRACTYVWKQRLTSASCHSLPCFLILNLKHIDCIDSLGAPEMYLSPSFLIHVSGLQMVPLCPSFSWCWLSHIMNLLLLAVTFPMEPFSQPLLIFKNDHLSYVSGVVGVLACAGSTVGMWKSKDNLMGSFLTFHMWVLGNQTQVTGQVPLKGKSLYPLRHLWGPSPSLVEYFICKQRRLVRKLKIKQHRLSLELRLRYKLSCSLNLLKGSWRNHVHMGTNM